MKSKKTTPLTEEQLKAHYRAMQRRSWQSDKTDRSKERFQKMQALSVLSRKKKKLSPPDVA